jgi:type IV pilus assembly protein PilC
MAGVRLFTEKKVPRTELLHFSRQLAAFIRAGVPILDGIQVIAEESANATFRRKLAEISDALRSGDPFSTAAAAQTRVFPAFYVDMLRASELTGRLDTVLDQLAAYLERDLEARRSVRSALAYPSVIFALSIVVIVILAAFVLPRFQKFFESLNAKLPITTRILLNSSTFLGHWWWAVTGGVAVAGLALFTALKTKAGRGAKDRLLLRLPVVGDLVRCSIVERFCRILGSMVEAGVPLPDAMIIASDATNNISYQGALASVRDEMLEGEGIARPVARTNRFPGALVQMMRVGEDTGTLDQQLAVAASYYEKELAYKLKRFTTLFEPAVIVFMGFTVGFVAIAVVSAMYGIFRQIGTLS